MKRYYDLHIHSALSPCADLDMTPNNIVQMAKLKGLDIIAIADHNSILNVKPAMEVAKELDLLVIPAMELETSEEIHVLCLFPNYSSSEDFYKEVQKKSPQIKNHEDIYGPQVYFNQDDEIIGKEENLLAVATTISVNEAINSLKELGGIGIPAHIDRPSYSILSNLGFIPEDLDLSCVEVKDLSRLEELKMRNPMLNALNVISNSDSHNLGLISEKKFYFDIEEYKIEQIIKKLCKKSTVF